MSWLDRIFRRRLYDDLSEELRQHIEERTERLMRIENLSRGEAEQAARRAFGNVTLIEQRSREAWQFPALESVAADIRVALRQARKSTGFSLAVVLLLGLGIGSATAVFSPTSCRRRPSPSSIARWPVATGRIRIRSANNSSSPRKRFPLPSSASLPI